MKQYCIILVWLLIATSTVLSQTLHIDVHDEPLNKVLNGLGLEISLDDRALSGYHVSASQSFDNPENALLWLLADKPFRFEKIGQVYVIIPYDHPNPKDINVTFQPTRIERIRLQGFVVSLTTGEPLAYATVSVLDNDNQLLTSSITTEKGQFTIQTSYNPAKLKISHLGYETLLSDIDILNNEPGVFRLTERVVALDEIVVTEDNRRAEINHAIYLVNPSMCEGIDNALELLNRIPGVYVDKSSKVIKLNQQENMLLLVDGIQYSHDYLYHLSPRRVYSIEVVYAISNRFVSDDYAGIIHYRLNKDYTGYDIHISGLSSYNLSRKANAGWTEHYPDIGITYTTRKLNFFGTYAYEWEKRCIPTSKSLTYYQSEFVSMPAERPNSLSQHGNHTITGGLNYHLSPLHLLGIQADYVTGNINSVQDFTMSRTDFALNQNRGLSYTTANLTRADMFAGKLFYQGQLGNRFRLYGDFSYHYYYNFVENEYRQDDNSGYRYADIWDEFKHQTIFNMEGKYLLSNKITIETGYSNIRRLYASESSQGRGFLDYSEQRNKAFAYFSWLLSNKAEVKSGIAFEHTRQRNGENGNNYLRLLPYMQLNYKISRMASITAGYATGQSYPSLYQLSPISIVIDSLLTRIGNPVLKSAVRHQVFAELTIGAKLTFTPLFTYINDGISEVYDRKEYKLYNTFENVDFREYSLHASYEQQFGTYYRVKNAVLLYHHEILHAGLRNTLNGWTYHGEVDFYHPATFVGARLEYYRNMRKDILWQGYQMSDKDYWCVSLRKEWWNNRLSATLSYIPPITFGVRYNSVKAIETLQYKENTAMNLESYNHMLLMKISFRFDRGSAKPAANPKELKLDER